MKSVKEYWQQTNDWFVDFSVKYPRGVMLPAGAVMAVGSASASGIGLALNSLLMGAFGVAASPLLIPGAVLAISGLALGVAGTMIAAVGAAFLPFEVDHNKKIKAKTNAADQQVRGTAPSLNVLENAQVKISSLTAPFSQSAEPRPKELEPKIEPSSQKPLKRKNLNF